MTTTAVSTARVYADGTPHRYHLPYEILGTNGYHVPAQLMTQEETANVRDFVKQVWSNPIPGNFCGNDRPSFTCTPGSVSRTSVPISVAPASPRAVSRTIAYCKAKHQVEQDRLRMEIHLKLCKELGKPCPDMDVLFKETLDASIHLVEWKKIEWFDKNPDKKDDDPELQTFLKAELKIWRKQQGQNLAELMSYGVSDESIQSFSTALNQKKNSQ